MALQYPHVVRADNYARSVVAGERVACQWVRLACQRHLDDKVRSRTTRWPWQFDRALAQNVCSFIEKLPHIKGKWAKNRETIKLEDWQCFILCSLFGWVHKETRLRRFLKALLMVPRKNAKTTLLQGVCLYCLVADGEYGAEVYAGATTEKQALELFNPARLMVEKATGFKKYFGINVFARNISVGKTGSKFEPVIGEPGDGASPSLAVHDEFHEHPTDAQWATMDTGMGGREQPLQIAITTAGENMAGPCYSMQLDCEKILQGLIEDDRTFFINYTIDKDDDWTKPEIAIKANPNFGVSVNADYLESARRRAMHSPAKAATYKTKHLNMWASSMSAYFDVRKWDLCEDKTLTRDKFFGSKAFVALDLSSKIDLAAVDLLIPYDGIVHQFSTCWLPHATIYEEEEKNSHYKQWHEQGFLRVTDGEVIDYDAIVAEIDLICEKFDVQAISYDPWNATMLATTLEKKGYPVQEYRQSVLNLSEPMKNLDALMRSQQIKHDGNPVVSWAISNVVAREDTNRNVKPNKEKGKRKIDPAVAMIMNIGAWMNSQKDDAESPYEKDDIVVV